MKTIEELKKLFDADSPELTIDEVEHLYNEEIISATELSDWIAEHWA